MFCQERIKSDEEDFVSFIHGEVHMGFCQDEDLALGVNCISADLKLDLTATS